MVRYSACLCLFAVLYCGCGPDDEVVAPEGAERSGVGIEGEEAVTEGALARAIDPRKSLIVTDHGIVGRFTLKAVMDQLVRQSGEAGLSSLKLFRQWWDTERPAPGLNLGAHCDDQRSGSTAVFNGFPLSCPRPEGAQALQDPFSNPEADEEYLALALVNRFDLAPANGANCGEYRMIFARRSGVSDALNRNLIIFEAVLANPHRELGLAGCRPVLDFWAGLSTKAAAQRGSELLSFYFNGLPGFSPVVHINNYGVASSGRVRSNQFMGAQWTLREFQLHQACAPGAGCTLRFAPRTVKVNPDPSLFGVSTSPLAVEFQGTGPSSFIASIPSLLINDVNRFSYAPLDKFNAAESRPQDPNTYTQMFAQNPAFRAQIQRKLTALGSPLTPENLVARAQALSCAGCHETSGSAPLGGGLTFPISRGFVQVEEIVPDIGPDGPRFSISPALRDVFLPRRKVVFEAVLNRPLLGAVAKSQVAPATVKPGQVFQVTVTMVNAGTTAWSSATGFKLMPASLQVRNAWGVSEVALAPTEFVHFGGTKAFVFNVRAPAAPGQYVLQWQMQRGATAFGALSPSLVVKVL